MAVEEHEVPVVGQAEHEGSDTCEVEPESTGNANESVHDQHAQDTVDEDVVVAVEEHEVPAVGQAEPEGSDTCEVEPELTGNANESVHDQYAQDTIDEDVCKRIEEAEEAIADANEDTELSQQVMNVGSYETLSLRANDNECELVANYERSLLGFKLEESPQKQKVPELSPEEQVDQHLDKILSILCKCLVSEIVTDLAAQPRKP